MKERKQALILIWILCDGAWFLCGFFLSRGDRFASITYLLIGSFLAVLLIFGIRDLRHFKGGKRK